MTDPTERHYDYVSFIAPVERLQEYLDQFPHDWHICSEGTGNILHESDGSKVLIIMEQVTETGTSRSSRPDLSRLNGQAEAESQAIDNVRRKLNMTLGEMLGWVNDATGDPEGEDLAGQMLAHVLTFILERPVHAGILLSNGRPGAELITQAEVYSQAKPPLQS